MVGANSRENRYGASGLVRFKLNHFQWPWQKTTRHMPRRRVQPCISKIGRKVAVVKLVFRPKPHRQWYPSIDIRPARGVYNIYKAPSSLHLPLRDQSPSCPRRCLPFPFLPCLLQLLLQVRLVRHPCWPSGIEMRVFPSVASLFQVPQSLSLLLFHSAAPCVATR